MEREHRGGKETTSWNPDDQRYRRKFGIENSDCSSEVIQVAIKHFSDVAFLVSYRSASKELYGMIACQLSELHR